VDAVCRNFAGDLDKVTGFRLAQAAGGVIAKRYPGKFMHDIRFERGLDIR
jgi:hypothetical protein